LATPALQSAQARDASLAFLSQPFIYSWFASNNFVPNARSAYWFHTGTRPEQGHEHDSCQLKSLSRGVGCSIGIMALLLASFSRRA
jgi:hypothetical protein